MMPKLLIEYNVKYKEGSHRSLPSVCVNQEDSMGDEEFNNYIQDTPVFIKKNFEGKCPDTKQLVTYDLLLIDTDKVGELECK
tara:strand:- start:1135 stop:1380 length:246 start_codon:yes stop_codon:yes gene_type:complete